MSSTPGRPMVSKRPPPFDRERLLTAVGGSLIPWAAFIAAEALAGVVSGEDTSTSISDVARAAPFLLAFIAVPSALPVAFARTRALQVVAVLVMTAASAIAGVVVTSDDAQAGLALLWVPLVALPLAAVLWLGQTVAASRARDAEAGQLATLSDRLAALAVDVVLVGVALVVPLTAMSHAKQEVAAVGVGVAAATAYFAGLVVVRGQTVGQSLLGLTVVDSQTLRRPASARAIVRSLIVVLEVAGAWTVILAAPAIAEAVSALLTGRSLTDRVLRTFVVTTGRNSV